jgi:hypothetical protein
VKTSVLTVTNNTHVGNPGRMANHINLPKLAQQVSIVN